MRKLIFAASAVMLMGASCNLPVMNKAQVGIVKTANGGVDWQSANRIKNTEQTLLEKSISQMKFDNNGEKIFASSFSGGLYSSDDAGENWSEVLGGVPIYDFAFNPFDDKIMYAASYMGDRGRVLMTRDGGKSWNEVYSDAGRKNPVRSVSVHPTNTADIYIGTDKGLLLYSADAGTTWELLQTFTDRVNSIQWEGPDLYVLVKNRGVQLSKDNGRSFSSLTERLRAPRQKGSYATTASIREFRQLAINPSNPSNMFVTTAKGLYSSRDSGKSWDYVSMPYRQQDASPFAVAVAPSSENVIYVSSGSVILKSTDGGITWTSSDTGTKGLVNTILVSRDLPQLTFAGVSQ